MVTQTRRFFFPLKIITYQEDDCQDELLQDVTPTEAVSYEKQIMDAIAKECQGFENQRGLAEYLNNEALKKKIQSIHPSVEVWNGELWGIMTTCLNDELTLRETNELISWIEGQNFDGFGEALEQQAIKTMDGDIYVSFANSGKEYFIRPEEELKREIPGFTCVTQT